MLNELRNQFSIKAQTSFIGAFAQPTVSFFSCSYRKGCPKPSNLSNEQLFVWTCVKKRRHIQHVLQMLNFEFLKTLSTCHTSRLRLWHCTCHSFPNNQNPSFFREYACFLFFQQHICFPKSMKLPCRGTPPSAASQSARICGTLLKYQNVKQRKAARVPF